jgi:hypothetical protein
MLSFLKGKEVLMGISETIAKRKNIRSYQDVQVPDEELDKKDHRGNSQANYKTYAAQLYRKALPEERQIIMG